MVAEPVNNRRRYLAMAALAVMLIGCPSAVIGLFGSQWFGNGEPDYDATMTAISGELALNLGEGISDEMVPTYVAQTLVALQETEQARLTMEVMLTEAATLGSTLEGFQETSTPDAVTEGTPTSGGEPNEPTSSPTITRTSTPTLFGAPTSTPTITRTPTPSLTPLPSNTSPPTATNTQNVCSLIDFQSQGASGQVYNIRVTNDTLAQVIITNVNITWPASNVAMNKVSSDGSEIWSGNDTSPPTSFACSGNPCRVNNNNDRLLAFSFDSAAAGSGYTLRLTFDNGCVVTESY